MNLKKTFEKFLSLPGVSGQEAVTANWLKKEFEKYCDEAWVDPSNSAVGLIRAKSKSATKKKLPIKKLMFAAHLDQVGLIVSKIEAGGFLRIVGLGYDPKVLLGQKVTVYGRKPIEGIVGFYPNREIYTMDDLFIDTGLSDSEVATNIRVGDEAKVDLAPIELEHGNYSSPFLDDRSCVMAMMLGMEELSNVLTDCDIYFVATSGEETTGKGASATANAINPDLAVVMDVTFAAQPGTRAPSAFPIGKGLTISVGPLYQWHYITALESIAKKERIRFVREPDSMGFGTDAASIRLRAFGIPVVLISLPIKSMHTPAELCSLRELKDLGRWVAGIGKYINRKSEQD